VHQTGSGAISAAGALFSINKSRLLTIGYLKITLFTVNAFNLGTSDKIDI
jgi:hypothetical protein